MSTQADADNAPMTTVVVHAASNESTLHTNGHTNGHANGDIVKDTPINNNNDDVVSSKDVDVGTSLGLNNGNGNSMTAQSMDDILTYDGKQVKYSVLRPENSGTTWFLLRILCPCRKARPPTFIQSDAVVDKDAEVTDKNTDMPETEVNGTAEIVDETEKGTADLTETNETAENICEQDTTEIAETTNICEIVNVKSEANESDELSNDLAIETDLGDDIDINTVDETEPGNDRDIYTAIETEETQDIPPPPPPEASAEEVVPSEGESTNGINKIDFTKSTEDIESLPEYSDLIGSTVNDHNDDYEKLVKNIDQQSVQDEPEEQEQTPVAQSASDTAVTAPDASSAVANHSPCSLKVSDEPEPEQDVIEMPPAMAIQEHLFASQPPSLPQQDSVEDLHAKLASTLSLKMPAVEGSMGMATTSVDIAAEMEMLVKQRMDPHASGSMNAEDEDSGTEEDVKEKYHKKRQFVIKELIDTEQDYVKDLGSIVEGYMGYIQENPLSEDMVGKDKIVFGNIHQIYDFHNETFLAELEKCMDGDGRRVGSLFTRYERRLYMYVKYCENKPKSEYIVAEYADTYFEDIRQKLGHRLQLPDLLIKPVQRIMKYQLLLKDILKFTDKAGDITDELKKAVKVMCVVPKAANDMMNVGRLQGFSGKITAQGKLLLQDTVMVAEVTPGIKETKFKERRVFLFEQIIIFSEMLESKKGRLSSPGYVFKHSIKVNKMSMRLDPDPLRFTIVDGTPGSDLQLMIQAQDEETKDSWVSQIQSILDMQGDFLRALQSPIAYMNKMQKSSGSQKELVKELSAPEMGNITKNALLRKTQSHPAQPRAPLCATNNKEGNSRQEKCRSMHSPQQSAESSIEEETPRSSCTNSPDVPLGDRLKSADLGSRSGVPSPSSSGTSSDTNSPKQKKNVGILEGFRNTLGRKQKNENVPSKSGQAADQSGDCDSNELKSGDSDAVSSNARR